MKYRTLETTIKLMQENYSRFRDTSAMPRDPVSLGHKPNDKERYHSVIRRLSSKNNITDTEKQLLSILQRKAAEIEDGPITTSLRTQNVNNINNDMFVQRQLHRARKQQNVKKKIDEDVASADRVKRIIAQLITLPDGSTVTRRRVRSWRARRSLVQRTKKEN